jgi:epoxyqueuosine reductase
MLSPELIELMHKDPRPVIRGTAAWAVGKIGGADVMGELEHALAHDRMKKQKLKSKKASAF